MSTRHAPSPHASAPRTSPPATSVTRTVPAPTTARLRRFRTPVRGHAFAALPPGVGLPSGGDDVLLSREPSNPADPHAVAVYLPTAGVPWRIGYLDRGVAARLGPRMDAGLRLRCWIEGWVAEPDGRWQRPLLVVAPEQAAVEPAVAEQAAVVPAMPEQAADDGARAPLWGRLPGVRRRVVGPAV